MEFFANFILGALSNFLGNLGIELLKDSRKQTALRGCLRTALETVAVHYTDLVYSGFLDKFYFRQRPVLQELAKLLTRSNRPNIDVLLDEYLRQWREPSNAPHREAREAIHLFVDELQRGLRERPEFNEELNAQTFEQIAATLEQIEALLQEAAPPVPRLTGQAGLLTWQDVESAGLRIADRFKSAKDFYNGARATWGNIYYEHDARRDSQDVILNWLRTQPETCVALVLAAGGDGKTTMLMRLAADLAYEGQSVVWRGSGDYLSWDIIAPYADHPFIVVADYAHELDGTPESKGDLAALVNHCQLHNLPVRFVIAARKNEWIYSQIDISRVPLLKMDWTERHRRLSPAEADRIIRKLTLANELGELTGKPREEQIELFVKSTEGQLLAALIAAKGGANFRDILQRVVQRINRRPDGQLLLDALCYTSAVYQWEAYMTRWLLAKLMNIPEADIDDLILKPLSGELVELEENADRIRTRHPVIAQVLFELLTDGNVRKSNSSYKDVFEAAVQLRGTSSRYKDFKLLTILPIAAKRAGNKGEARRLLASASQADPKDAPVWQAWALLEKEQGDIARARQLFERASQADPKVGSRDGAWEVGWASPLLLVSLGVPH